MSTLFFVNKKNVFLKISLLFTIVLVAFLCLRAYKVSAAYGDLQYTYCSGYDYHGVYDDGNGGTYDSVIESNYSSCGYVACDPNGTLESTYCSGYDKRGTFADGNCGTYDGDVENPSTSCGYNPCPGYGTYLGNACSGYDYYEQCADGSCGSYDCGDLGNPSSSCGYTPPQKGQEVNAA